MIHIGKDPSHAQYVVDLQYVIGVINGLNVVHDSPVLEACTRTLADIANYHASKAFDDPRTIESRIGFAPKGGDGA